MDADPYPSSLFLMLDPSVSFSTLLLITVILLALLLLSALLAGSQKLLFSPLNAEQRISLRESDGKSEKAVSHLLDKPQQLLATLLISINFVNIIFITLANYLTELDGAPIGGNAYCDFVSSFRRHFYHYVFWARFLKHAHSKII
jgi:uncharacterized protein YqhQ